MWLDGHFAVYFICLVLNDCISCSVLTTNIISKDGVSILPTFSNFLDAGFEILALSELYRKSTMTPGNLGVGTEVFSSS